MTTPRRYLRRGVLDETDEQTDDEADAASEGTDRRDSSLEDLVSPADPSSFDRTFLAGDASLDIEGGFDPVAGRKQVIPRVAYVLNFNLVYNPNRDRWEPDTGGFRSGGEVAVASLEKTQDQSVPTGGGVTTVEFDQTGVDTLGTADPNTDSINIPTSGIYRVSAGVGFKDIDDKAQPDHDVTVNGTVALAFDGGASGKAASSGHSQHTAKPLSLDGGDTVKVEVNVRGSADATVIGSAISTHLAVAQLSGG